MILSVPVAMAIAIQCLGSTLAPIMVGIAQHESGLDPAAIHHNANGTVDVGIAQINTSNFRWLGLTMQTALDPCQNLAAGARVLFARYNGSPPDAVKAAYAASVTARISTIDGSAEARGITNEPLACPVDNADGWHVAAASHNCSTSTDWHVTSREKGFQ
jgi:hypothetical protein